MHFHFQYNNLLQISSLGRIRVKEHISDKTGKIWKEHTLAQVYDKGKRKIYVAFKKKKIYLKPLVAKYFLENPNQYKYIAHKDKNILNISADNLYWTNEREYNSRWHRKEISEFQKIWEHRFDHQEKRGRPKKKRVE